MPASASAMTHSPTLDRASQLWSLTGRTTLQQNIPGEGSLGLTFWTSNAFSELYSPIFSAINSLYRAVKQTEKPFTYWDNSWQESEHPFPCYLWGQPTILCTNQTNLKYKYTISLDELLSTKDDFVPQGTFGNVWRPFGLSSPGGRGTNDT